MIRFKVDVLKCLKAKGYSSYKIRKEKLIPQGIVERLRLGDIGITVRTLEQICDILECQPGDLLEWTKNETVEQKEGEFDAIQEIDSSLVAEPEKKTKTGMVELFDSGVGVCVQYVKYDDSSK